MPLSGPDVAGSWDRIRRWLATGAPGVLARIRPPAEEADLDRVAEALGVPLPEDLLAWWRLADGVADAYPHPGHLLPPWFDPYPVSRALDSRSSWIRVWHKPAPEHDHARMTRELGAWLGTPEPTVEERVAEFMAQPAGTPCDAMYLPVWLPIAGDNGGADLFVDLREGPLRGCVMRFDKVGTAVLEPDWPSLAAMLADVADGLERGRTTGAREPATRTVADGVLRWE
ncbi:SMI1/KNR4 family protein [Amycolatopsis sp. CA-230715]|uniref:SMI1/KNR4 family protein n=1 Tax=Amycolatopsis sp. CA-230715 TaxID=2745196 RepID=UPI001C0266BF|nr:SMI1/KNR4 family protein [Amycolatopsis sp. CA-230715]